MSLKNIKKKSVLKAPSLLAYGPAGIGKSSFGSTLDKPIFLLTEDGLGTLQVDHFPLAKSWLEIKESLLSLLKEDHDFKSVVLDSADWLEPLIWDHVCKENDWADISSAAYGKGYTAALEIWREYIALTNSLRDQKGMTILNLAHVLIRRFEDPVTESYDRMEIKLHRKAADLLIENSDAVFYMAYKKGTVQTAGKGGTQTKVLNGDRTIFCEEQAAYLAKNRYQLKAEMPFSWKSISDMIRANAKANAEESKEAK